jgi:predicted GNAT family N-acyltransferase
VVPEPTRRIPRPTPVAFLGARDPVHGAVAPADVRAGDPIVARVRLAEGGREIPAQVWRISPVAVELVRTLPLAALAVGSRVALSLRLGASETRLDQVEVSALRSERGRDLVALRWVSGAAEADEDAGEKRAASRWTCGTEFVPTGVAPNAVRYDDFVHFRIVDISRTGMRLVTSLRNKFLLPGVSFEATVTFPTMGEARVAFRVVHARVVQEGAKKVLALGVTYALGSRRAGELIGQYLLQFGPGASLAQLRETGFEVVSSSRALEFGCVRTDEEYREVLELRRLAYVHAKKASADVKDVDMADDFDARSRILVAKYRGRVVASARLMFPRHAEDALKHEEFLSLPATLPPRDEIVEISKVCTHPAFRGSDLFYGILKQAALTVVQSGRKWFLMSCTDSLLPVYAKVGLRKIGAGYLHPTMKLAHHVCLGDVAGMIAGKRINPIVWNVVIGHELYDFAARCGAVPRTAWWRLRVRLWRLFRPLGYLAVALHARRARGGR